MLFRNQILEGIKDGTVTLAFRRWRRAPPADGSTLRTAVGVIALTQIATVDEAAITTRDARRAGFDSRDALIASFAPTGTIYRMHVRVVADDPRAKLRERRLADEHDAAAVLDRLNTIDHRARSPWARALLDVVGAHPGVAARHLADLTSMDRDDLKRRMRQLKELGLTESLDVGYRLSPRGRDVHALLGRERHTRRRPLVRR